MKKHASAPKRSILGEIKGDIAKAEKKARGEKRPAGGKENEEGKKPVLKRPKKKAPALLKGQTKMTAFIRI